MTRCVNCQKPIEGSPYNSEPWVGEWCSAECQSQTDARREAAWSGHEMPVAEYLVMNENCLGYAYAEQPHLFNILASAIGGPDHWSTPIALDRPNTRPATLADFERYRVDPKGHLT